MERNPLPESHGITVNPERFPARGATPNSGCRLDRHRHAARLELVPMKRMGTVDEIANLVLFLLSDESSYCTGAEVAIDGGSTL